MMRTRGGGKREWEREWVAVIESDPDDRGFVVAYGLRRDLPISQELGHIVAEDKCVAFSNVYQHRVDASELADRVRLGPENPVSSSTRRRRSCRPRTSHRSRWRR